jgi:hypothetical protein
LLAIVSVVVVAAASRFQILAWSTSQPHPPPTSLFYFPSFFLLNFIK